MVRGTVRPGMTEGPLSELTAIVTGASAGIGRETARVLAREGANVALAARREERLETVAEEIESAHGTETLVMPTDVTDEDAVADLVDATVAQFGGVDVAVNNAGVGVGERHYDLADLSTEDYRRVKSVNEDGVFFLTRAVLPHVREAEGHLIYVASYAGQQPRAYDPVYAASKWWMRGFAKSVSSQVGEAAVGVTVVNPAAVRTEFDVDGEPMADRYGPGEAVEPAEVAETIAFAAEQSPSMIHEVDVYTRDKLGEI